MPSLRECDRAHRTEGAGRASSFCSEARDSAVAGVNDLHRAAGKLALTLERQPGVGAERCVSRALAGDETRVGELGWQAIRNLIIAGGDSAASLQGTTLSGRRVDAYGAVACSSSPVFGILRPLETTTGGFEFT